MTSKSTHRYSSESNQVTIEVVTCLGKCHTFKGRDLKAYQNGNCVRIYQEGSSETLGTFVNPDSVILVK